MDDERRKAILLALACLAILILLIIECAIMPRMGWLWIITAASTSSCSPCASDTSSAEAANEPRHRGRAAPHQGTRHPLRGRPVDMEATGCGEVRRGTPPPARHTRQTLARDPDTAGIRTRSRPGTCSPAATRRRHGTDRHRTRREAGRLLGTRRAIPPDGRFYPNPGPSAAYPLLELERAGIIRPVEPAITAYGPYGRPTRLMEVTEPYHNPMLRALRMR